MLATKPVFSRLAAIGKLYDPLTRDEQSELITLMQKTDKFADLPDWAKTHLITTQILYEEEKAELANQELEKHLSGQHDQATHGKGGAKGPSSSQGKAPSTKYAAADYADVMDLLPEYDELDDALVSYSGENYRKMNDYLRDDAPISNKLKNQVDLIQEELNKTSLPKPMEFTRGQSTLNGFSVTSDANGKLIFEKYEWIDGQDNPTMSIDSLVGQKWESKGFLSTSAPTYLGQDVRGAGFTANPIQMKILAPAGTRGAGISSQEFEYLLPYGTSFEIVGASSIGGQVQLTMEVTNQK